MLTDLLWSLTDDERQRVSSLHITRDIARGWIVTLSYAGMVTTSREEAEDGVTETVAMRRPDSTHDLPQLTGADPQDDVSRAVRALESSGLVGGIHASRYESATLDAMTHQPFPAWVIKTHAGSDAERARWAMSVTDE